MDIFQGRISLKHKTIVILYSTQRPGFPGIELHLFYTQKLRVFSLWKFVGHFGKFNQMDYNKYSGGFMFACFVP